MTNFRQLSQLLTRIENRESGFWKDLAGLYSKCRHVPVWGFTGPPGAGKSTLVDKITRNLRKKSLKVAILAIDPSSPFSGGSVLGDRIRMQRHFEDEGVFIRSLGHRGSPGGLSNATADLIVALDAHGFDHILIETVGVGQTELGIMEVADSTAVLLVPEAGDAVQMLKAGLTEIADLFVINKADRPGSADLQKILQATLMYSPKYAQALGEDQSGHHGKEKRDSRQNHAGMTEVDSRITEERAGMTEGENEEGLLRPFGPRNDKRDWNDKNAGDDKGGERGWEIPVLLTQAETGDGVEAVVEHLYKHTKCVRKHPVMVEKQKEARRRRFLDLYWEAQRNKIEAKLVKNTAFKKIIEAVAEGTKNPYEAIQKILG